MRVVITGGSGTGKTTLSRRFRDVCHADDYVGRELIVMMKPHRARTLQQRRQQTQVQSILARMVPSLQRRGVRVEYA